MATRGGGARAGAREPVAEDTRGRRGRLAVRKGAGPTIGPSEKRSGNEHGGHLRKARKPLEKGTAPPSRTPQPY
jgi:hypothetical protein